MTKYFLGIDTSAYTTSIGVVDGDGRVLSNQKEILEVKSGQRGLRQQEAIFQHMINFPKLLDKVALDVDLGKVVSVAVSSRPRNMEGSYMPVFKYGESQAKIISRLLNTSYREYSHQEGHIGSALLDRESDSFIALHISGGTSELLAVNAREKNIEVDIIGESKDISFGQLIDRVGVKMGIAFPAGKHMDELSEQGQILDLKLSKSLSGLDINLSGLESELYRAIESGRFSKESLCKTLFYHIASMLEQLLLEAVRSSGKNSAYLVGGVSSNSIVRKQLASLSNVDVIFPKAELSTDNGVGLAYLEKRREG